MDFSIVINLFDDQGLFFAKDYRISTKNYIDKSNTSRTNLSDICTKPNLNTHICRPKPYSINTIHTRKKQSSFDMKWLGNNGKSTSLSENFFCTNNRIESTKSCKIKSNRWVWNASFYESFSHRFRLIICFCTIIARDKNMTNLPSFIESFCRFYTGGKKDIIHSIYTWSGTEKKSDFIHWNTINVTIKTLLCHQWDNNPWKRKKNNSNTNEKKKLTHNWFLGNTPLV